MSDHEGGDFTDWEDASLPGGPDFSFRGSESINHEVLPRMSFQETSGQPAPRRPQSESFSRPSRAERGPPTSYRSEIQAIDGLVHRTSGIQGRKAKLPVNAEPIIGPAYESFKRRDEPTDVFFMSVTWKVLMSNIRFHDWPTPERAARSQLDDICRKTGAYVSTPDSDMSTIEIWGLQEQAEAAKKELTAWHDHIRETGLRPNRWHKEKAFDGRTASRQDQKVREKEMAGALRRMESDVDYNFELYTLWPDEPKIAEFIDRYDKTDLEDIRSKTLCKIEFDEGAPAAHYKVSAQSETHVKDISLRINYLIMAMVKQKGEFIRCTRFKLPPASQYRDCVGWEKDSSSGFFLPFLHGEPLPADEIDDWTKLCTSEELKNRTVFRDAISKCLSSLYAPTKHVRMRVTFAELAFRRYQRPPPDRDYHTVNEFCAMVPHQNVQLSPLGLRARRGDLADLADVLSTMPEFGTPRTIYTLHFDFNSRNDSTLRLEIELEIGIMTGETETTATRWLEFSSDANEYEMLEANMVDLQHLKCNYQIHIGGTKLFEPQNTKFGVGKQMYSFKDKVRFYPPPDGIKAPPKRRAVYPSGNRDLRRVEEITTVRYPFRDTDGVFELQRKDIYAEQGLTSSTPVSSVWAGKYYYPEWDTLMDDFANLKPGEPVKWTMGLAGFFLDGKATSTGPRGWAAGPSRPLPKGFRTWLKEIGEIQALVAEGIERIEASAPEEDVLSVV
ncbi:hypothetical protein DV735_g1289, partial [Chaetothyriales sp. CBS 134920]